MIVMITNTIVPYCYDIAHIIGLPSNFPHRFRYRQKWIKIPGEIESIKRQKGVIVLRHFQTGDFIPIRYIQIEDVLPVGDINYIEFRMGDYFPVRMKKVVSNPIKDALEREGYANEAGKALDCLVFEMDKKVFGELEKKRTGDEQEKWSDILRELGGLSCYENFSFLKILNISDSNERKADITLDETGKYSFRLEPGRLYFLDVIQHIPWQIDNKESIEAPYDVELKAETGEVTILRKIQRVVGKYDLLRFIFKTAPGYTTKHTFLELENKQEGEMIKYVLPALFLPIQIRPPGWMRWLLKSQTLLSVLAVIMVITSDLLARLLEIGPDWIRAMGLLLLIICSGKWNEIVTELVKEGKGLRIG